MLFNYRISFRTNSSKSLSIHHPSTLKSPRVGKSINARVKQSFCGAGHSRISGECCFLSLVFALGDGPTGFNGAARKKNLRRRKMYFCWALFDYAYTVFSLFLFGFPPRPFHEGWEAQHSISFRLEVFGWIYSLFRVLDVLATRGEDWLELVIHLVRWGRRCRRRRRQPRFT